MPHSIFKATLSLTTLLAITACSSSTTAPTPPPPPPPPSTALNFSTATTPPVGARSITQTGLAASNAVTQASYDQPSDTLTLTRTGTTPVTLTGATTNHPQNADVDLYRTTGTTSGTALVAHTATGAGYAVAFYDNSTATTLDPQASALHGGTRSTAGTPSNIGGGTFNGEYLGYASQSLGGVGTASGSITGDVALGVNATGTAIVAGTLISNRQSNAGPVNSVTNGATAINGNLEFSNLPLTTTGLLGLPASGQADGAFFEATPNNLDGEVVGTVVMRGGAAGCNLSGNITVAGRNCVLETGVFVAR